jgi:hypothetical protein
MKCVRCGSEAMPKIKYCKICKKSVIAEMENSGYLQRQVHGHVGATRGFDKRENTYETKHGTGY